MQQATTNRITIDLRCILVSSDMRARPEYTISAAGFGGDDVSRARELFRSCGAIVDLAVLN
jgi:hypothetical protein